MVPQILILISNFKLLQYTKYVSCESYIEHPILKVQPVCMIANGYKCVAIVTETIFTQLQQLQIKINTRMKELPLPHFPQAHPHTPRHVFLAPCQSTTPLWISRCAHHVPGTGYSNPVVTRFRAAPAQ